MKKLVVCGWLTVAGMTLFDTFRKREDGTAIWSNVKQMIEDIVSSKVDEKIAKASIVACVIFGAPVFAVLKVIAIVRWVIFSWRSLFC